MEHLPIQMRLKRMIERTLANFKRIGKGNLTAATIRSRIATLKENWTQFQAGHDKMTNEIDTKAKETMEYFTEEYYDETEEHFQKALDFMVNHLEEIEPPVSPNQSFASTNSHPEKSGLSLSHLPTIRLPPFDGNADEWEQFRDRFTTLIKNNTDLNNFARMHFLTSCVKGRALETIANLPVTGDNFEIAWRALTSRFESKRRSLNSHLSTLVNLTALTRESADDLRALLDKASIAIESLRKLDRTPEDLWNDILIHLLVHKLDPITKKAWNFKEGDVETPPSYDALSRFLNSRARALEEFAASTPAKSSPKSASSSRVNVANATKNSKSTCPLCQAPHRLYACSDFVSKSANERREIIKQYKRCFNCLGENHFAAECKSKYTCRECKQKHHSLLHSNFCSTTKMNSVMPDCSPPQNLKTQQEVASNLASTATYTRQQILLATAWVTVRVSSGRNITVRALLDQGSEMTFISENLAQMLYAKRNRISIAVSGVGGTHAGQIRHSAQIWISPRDSLTPSFGTTALIMNSLTAYAPKRSFDVSSIAHLSDLHLADTDPTSTDPINLLIGADLYNELITDGVRKGGRGKPLAQNSVLGWLISGPIEFAKNRSARENQAPHTTVEHISVHHVVESSTLEEEVRRFWEIEEIPKSIILTPQDEQCENHFRETHSREKSGRYIVRLPFNKGPPIDIGESRLRAENCLKSLTRRFRSAPEHEKEYSEFLSEYEKLGHMRPAPVPTNQTDQICYIPHHSVIRESSTTSRLRVVFNASSTTSNGTSLNDHLLAGKKLQSEITSVILQWRRHKFVYSADIAKMYRQIHVDARDLDYQRILWKSSSEEHRDYQLLTVTYGTACAPFLALRVIKQLIEDEGYKFPLAVPVLSDNIYVDDVLFGAHEADIIKRTRDQVVLLLSRGGFELRKWASNSVSLLEDIDSENHGLACNKQLSQNEQIKILGLTWNPASDNFEFSVTLKENVPKSKRSILSTIAKFYDPLGWVTPVTVSAKILLQQLWQEKLGWDEKIPEDFFARWSKIYSQLSNLNGLRVPRWLGLGSETNKVEIHGFADASNFAYAAVVYLKVTSSLGKTTVTLLAGKSKVAPLKTISIPRLELCAALLLARLVEFVHTSQGFETFSCHCWTDSTVVLAWVTQHPSRWKTFVANRVADIQSRLTNVTWRHVPTSDNPADCTSRGLLGNEITKNNLWWHGPSWLQSPPDEWPVGETIIPTDTDLEEKIITLQCSQPSDSWKLASRYSSWFRLIRVTAYILRFTRLCSASRSYSGDRCCKIRSYPKSCRDHCAVALSKNFSSANGVALAASECQEATKFWIKKIQSELFPDEIKALVKKQNLSSSSAILSLSPFIDQDGVLRVGGRLSKSPFPFSFRHPILLSAHPLVTLIVNQAHLRLLHAGAKLTLNVLRREFWILRARSIVKSVIHNCVKCTRERAATPTQIMGNLPETRVSTSTRCFLHCGVDYAGPIHIRTSAGRGFKSHKAYIALFICLAAKAIHLELVKDYSTNAFLNAYSRFCARRGLPQAMYSDNGTTFTGADRELTLAYKAAVQDPNFLNTTASDSVEWNFIPPSAPHFGGLWEAGVKSMKHHLRRVVGSHTLTVDEFSTLLCKIEACLNSRPIGPTSDTMDDYECLTPGHFLIGSALAVHPEPSLLNLKENRLSRWQLVQHITERFWKLWQTDYVNTLQQRTKWRKVQSQIKLGQLVLLRNPNLPPCKWELGRVTQCHPGSDDLTRVVTVKTAQSEFRRPINKICVLPVECEATSN